MDSTRAILTTVLATVCAAFLTALAPSAAFAGSADLAITRLSAQKLVEDGEISITATVTNQGPDACGPCSLKIGANCPNDGSSWLVFPIAAMVHNGQATHTATFPLWCDEAATYCTWARANFPSNSVDGDPDGSNNYASTNEVEVILDGSRGRDFGMPIHNVHAEWQTFEVELDESLPVGWSASVDPQMISVPPNSVGTATLSVAPPPSISEYPAIQLTSHCVSGDLPDAGFTYQTTAGTVMWSDDFHDCTISDWTVLAGSGGVLAPQAAVVHSPPCALRCSSQGAGYAWGYSPPYPFDQYCDYKISFWFMVPNTNNQQFVVMDNGHVSLIIDMATTLAAVTEAGVQPFATLNPGQWYWIECSAYAHSTDYEIFLDGFPMGMVDYHYQDAEPRIHLGDMYPGSTQRGAAYWDDLVVTGIPLPPEVDVEICDWPRPAQWWLGAHVYCDREEIEPGETATLYATVRNIGADPATDVTVQMFSSDPTLAQHAYDYELDPIGTEPIAEIPPGDSVVVGPFFFTAPPEGNSFGEDYWSFFVTSDAPADPYTTGWPEEDNNVIGKAAWQREATPGEPQRLSFWVTNPDPDYRKVTIDLDGSGLPPGWSINVVPSPGQELTLAPYERVGGFLEVTPAEEGELGIVVLQERVCDMGGSLIRGTGGLTGTWLLTRSVFVHYDGIPTQEDEDSLADLIGDAEKISYRCKYVPYICVRSVLYTLLDDILGLDGVLDTSPIYTDYHYLDTSARAIHARASDEYPGTSVEEMGYDGTGINIAIIDTGVDDEHESLNGKYVAGFNAITDDEVNNPDDNLALIFHGTHCAGIAMGTGGDDEDYRGVAPGAGLIDVKVLSALGRGTQDDVVQGIEWCIEHREEHSIRVLSLSLGSQIDSDGTDPECVAVNTAVDSGLVVVVAAGNSGPDNEGLGPPGAADKVITVASMCDSSTVDRDDDIISSFSNRGPRKDDGDGDAEDEQKPEIAAPGGDGGDHQITSARGSAAPQIAAGYHAMSGTSMACPHIAGVAALILEADPTLTPAEVKEIIINTADDWGPAGWDTAFGYGYVDAYRAVMYAIPAADAEICQWFRPDDFWTGVHIGMEPVAEMDTDYEINVTVSNVGDFATEPGTVTLLYGEATTSLHYPDTEFSAVGTFTSPPLAPGDSAVIGPFLFHSPAEGNSFGEPFYSFIATVNSSQDPIRSGWPVEDNNVACRSNWLIPGPCVVPERSAEPQAQHFWIRNPLSEPAHAKLRLEIVQLPPGWTVELVPPPGQTLTLPPLGSLPATLTVTPLGSGLATVNVSEELYNYEDRFLRVTGGICSNVAYSDPGALDDAAGTIPERIFLAQNRPNPFAPATIIRFGLPQDGKVALTVYDVQGARVRRLVDGTVPAGFHDILWDGRNQGGAPMASGIYFYVMKAGDFREVRRMMVVK